MILICERLNSGIDQIIQPMNWYSFSMKLLKYFSLLERMWKIFINQTIKWCFNKSFVDYGRGYFIVKTVISL